MPTTPQPPADMMPPGPAYGRCDHREKLPGLDDSGAWRCGREAFHAGRHAYHPEFHEVLGPIVARARAVAARGASAEHSRPSNDCEHHGHSAAGYCPGCLTEEKDRDRA